MNLRRILPLALAAALAGAAGCNTTKTDGTASGTTPGTNQGGQPTTATAPAPSGAGAIGSITTVTSAGNQMAPDFTWRDAGGERKLSDYRGKVVLINFWGTWCPPCRRELPALVKIREELGQEKFEIVGINIGEQPRGGKTVEQHVADFAASNNIRYPLVIGDEAIVNAYGGIEVVPTTFIVDGTGRIVESIRGSRDEAGFRALIEKAM